MSFGWPEEEDESRKEREKREAVVAEALNRLEFDERQIVIQRYFLGRTFREVSELSGWQERSLKSLHARAMRKLKRLLQKYARQEYGIMVLWPSCQVCESPNRDAIDRMIENRDHTSTWKPVLAEIRRRFGIDIRSPQRLIGHERYHLKPIDPDFIYIGGR